MITRKNILIVDDEEEILFGVKTLLNLSNYRAIVEKDSNCALNKILESFEKKLPYDLLIVDIQMPKLTGFYLIDKIRKKHLPLKILPMTGYYSKEYLGGLKERGFTNFLRKPFESDELLQEIEEILN